MSGQTVKFYNYSRTLQSKSEYAQRMKLISASIFGDLKRPTDKETMRVSQMMARRPYEERKELVQYYPALEETQKLMRRLRYYGLFRDEHQDFKDEMERIRKLRGRPSTWAKREDFDSIEPDED